MTDSAGRQIWRMASYAAAWALPQEGSALACDIEFRKTADSGIIHGSLEVGGDMG